jgi:Asp-tRNA(Asn)/Glu-tRNA(Gln) amidotransferase A subunit family amidase
MDLGPKGPMGLNALTAADASRKLTSGEITSEALVRDCLERITARDDVVKAWAFLDPDLALEQARARDAEPRRGPLHGMPIGIKDIFDTADMPTGHGFPPYAGKSWGVDSACVAAFRKAGMVILGKTVTTEFACPSPLKTTNPHDPTRTPGVSSSGSGAAVADFMVPLANGTQTGGSVIGPSANCGVYGYKASLNGLDRTGLRHCKKSIDTLGLMGRSVDDLLLARAASVGGEPGRVESQPPRIGLLRTAYWDQAEPCTQAVVEQAASLLESAGAQVSDFELPSLYTEIEDHFAVVNGWEGCQTLETEIRDNLDAFNAHNRERVGFVDGISEADYVNSGRALDAARSDMDRLFDGFDLFLTPSLTGEAPVGLTEVRSAVFARLWTQMYTPAVNLPLFEGPHGLPVCIQLVGQRNSDDATLANAAWADAALRKALGDVPKTVQ